MAEAPPTVFHRFGPDAADIEARDRLDLILHQLRQLFGDQEQSRVVGAAESAAG